MHNKVKPCFQFHLLHSGPLKLQKGKSVYFGCSRRIVKCHKICVACLSPQLHWEGGCIWWWLLAGRSSQSVTKAALKHLLLCHYKWMVMENQLCPTFCACWAHCSSAHGWFIFWKAFKQSSYVCSHTSPPEKQSNSCLGATPILPLLNNLGYMAAQECSQAVAPAWGTCSRVLSMPQNLDRDSGREQGIPGCHSLSRHTHTILQRGWKGLQPMPRNGAQGSQTCHLLQLARMLYMSIWKPQEFASDSTGICPPSTDKNQPALPVPPRCSPMWHLAGFAVTPLPSFRSHLCLLWFASTSW